MKKENESLDSAHAQTVERVYYENILFNQELNKGTGKYSREKWLGTMIAQGEAERLNKVLQSCETEDLAKLSQKPFRQQIYDIIIGISMAGRAAIDGGVKEEEAYAASDAYIQKADSCTGTKELLQIYENAAIAFAERVQKYRDNHQMLHSVQIAVDYILRNLHNDINLKNIAQQAGFSETYFSALFKKETGDTVTEFIQKSRVEEAKNLLQYSEFSLTSISQYLGFCSQSHFSQTFRRYTQMTPGQYRKKYFKHVW